MICYPAMVYPAHHDRAQVQCQRAADPPCGDGRQSPAGHRIDAGHRTDAFVVPRMGFDIAHMQKAQAKTPCLAGIGQTDQQIGDLAAIGLEPMALQ